MNNPSLKICICGAGTMGSGIAGVFATHGFAVTLYDLDDKMTGAARERISRDIQSFIDKKKIAPPEKANILERIHFTSDLNDCIADFVLEAIVEKPEAKAALFNKLAGINKPTTIFATNTSSLSVTAIAEKMLAPERLAGMHFFNPAMVMKLIEVVRTKYASEETIRTVMQLARAIGKVPVTCKDAPGFIVNRVARPYYLESLYLAEKTGAPVDMIDRLMESCGFKMGPFRLMDLIGNDINYSVSCIVYEALGKPARLKPSPNQMEKVKSGYLGRKTGKGYYEYPAQ